VEENLGGLLDFQAAILWATVVELRLAFSSFPVMHTSSTAIVPQPDTQENFLQVPISYFKV